MDGCWECFFFLLPLHFSLRGFFFGCCFVFLRMVISLWVFRDFDQLEAMTLNDLKLKVKKVEKRLVICLLSGIQLSINYHSNKSIDLYVVTNGNVYKNYIQNLIRKHKDVHLIIQYSSIESIMRMFKFIYQINSLEYILPIPTTILYDSSEIENLQLSPDFILTQQIIRYLNMKHGATIMSLSNVEEVTTVENINDVLNLENLAPKPIFESTSERINSLEINLYIPSSWDSWNKIVVQGKSFVLPDTEQIIRDESKLELLDSNYEKFLNDQYDLHSVLQGLNPEQSEVTPVETNFKISLSDMLREIVQPSVVE